MLRVVSFNLQHGKPGAGAAQDPATAGLAGTDISDPGAAREVLAALADQLRALDADVIALQEVDLGQSRSGAVDQTSELARFLGWDSYRFAATYAGPVAGLRRRPLRSALERVTDDALGPARALLGRGPAGFGNALLTRWPVSAWYVQRLGRGPAQVSRRGGHRLDPRSYRVDTSTMRNLVAARIEPAGPSRPAAGEAGPAQGGRRPAQALSTDSQANDSSAHGGSGKPGAVTGLTAASTHLATRTATAAAQLAAAWAALNTLPGPHVLAGDLNLRPEGLAPLGIARQVGEGWTYPAGAPNHRIDHVLTDPWPVDAAGRPLPGDEIASALGPTVAGTNGGPAPLLQAVGSGTRSLLVSDHAATWVDLEPVG